MLMIPSLCPEPGSASLDWISSAKQSEAPYESFFLSRHNIAADAEPPPHCHSGRNPKFLNRWQMAQPPEVIVMGLPNSS
jgi:hypothetical protein